MSHQHSSSTDPSSSDQGLEDLLAELLLLPIDQRDPALADLQVQDPARARVLRRRLELLAAELPLDDDGEDQTFGRFRLLRRLGGGVTDVYEAHDPERTERVVLKVLRHPAIQSSTWRNSLAQQALVAAQVDHPCIGRVLASGDVDGVPYILCPFVDGITLAQWIQAQQLRRRRVGPEELALVAGWLHDVAQGLAAAHTHGLIHRDVKPENILIPFQGRAQIIDFGLSEAVERVPDAGPQTPGIGTLAYLPPELLSPRERPVGPAADVYALGITLFEATAQRLPFAADTRGEMIRKILRGRLPDVRRFGFRLPRGLQRILRGATAPLASDRYPSATELACDLDRLRRGEPAHGAGPSTSRRIGRWLARHPALVATGLTMLLAFTWATVTLVDLGQARAAALAALELLETPARVQVATEHATRLVPGWPDQIPALQAWLHDEGEPLLEILPQLRAGLERELRRANPDAAVVATLAGGLAALEPFAAEQRGTLASMRRRLAWAQVVERVTIADHDAEWASTRAQIAADPRYRGLDLPPQLDLVPLGRDPFSGLFEFYHPRSGGADAPPVARATDGRLRRSDQSGLVFVLIPAGTFLMGQQKTDPTQPRYDPDASPYAAPESVTLAAFFISKYEMTQGQWWRLTGELPSEIAVGSVCAEGVVTYMHPVESVSALECDEVLGAVGLVLPTEAQWEYAAGTGAVTRWFFGDDPAALVRFANVCDLSYGDPDCEHFEFDDGFAATAPVGQKLPNPFGLHDCLGNVEEWCLDCFVSYAEAPPRPGDGLRTAPPDARSHRVLRGGSFMSGRCVDAYRRDDLPDRRNMTIGLRPTRPLLPERP